MSWLAPAAVTACQTVPHANLDQGSLRFVMQPISATDARARFYRLIDETAESHEPILITGQHNNAVLVSEQDWRAIQETLYLLSVPGLRESVQEGLNTPIENCDTELSW